MSRGLSDTQAMGMIVKRFHRAINADTAMEYAGE